MRLATWPLLLILVIFAAGCGEQTANLGRDAIPTPTAQPTASPSPAATPHPAAKLTGPYHTCDPVDSHIAYIHIGDLRVTPVGYALSYASTLLSVASASKPYKLPDTPNSVGGTLANPSLKEGGSGYAFTICNTSKTAWRTINAVNVKLEQFAAYSDPANTWQFCDGYYNRTNGAFSGGCGGGLQFDEALHATFAAGDTTGAEVTATQTDTTTYGDIKVPPLPVAIGPSQQLILNLGLTPPKAIGFYTFGFSVSLDGTAPTHISTMAATLFDSKAVRWDGKACNSNPAMLNQIPQSDMSGDYICPE